MYTDIVIKVTCYLVGNETLNRQCVWILFGLVQEVRFTAPLHWLACTVISVFSYPACIWWSITRIAG
jgi:hypothetical protein